MKIFTVDSFTSEPFKGNPAGVCVLDRALSDESYLKIAAEINYAETAFVIKSESGFNLRWFTPTIEVDLCGHATLATAKVLYDKYDYPKDEISFFTRSGELTVKKTEGGLLEMNFPYKLTTPQKEDSLIVEFVQNRVNYYGEDGIWVLVEVSNEAHLSTFEPDISMLKKHHQKVFIITAKSSLEGIDFVSRLFAPAMGIDEDPVTGAAHCYLAGYWNSKLNKNPTRAKQISCRTGELECEIISDDRVLLRGDAIIMAELHVSWELN